MYYNPFVFDEFVCKECGATHKISFFAQEKLSRNSPIDFVCECGNEIHLVKNEFDFLSCS